MSEKINDGGPAFPCEQGHTPEGTWNQTFDPGMSLRDWFAGQALGVFAQYAEINQSATYDVVARHSYLLADAMLKAREAGNG